MDRKIRVAAVDYLNTKPLIYGFNKGAMEDEIELIEDYPAKVASMLIANQVDIGLVPVATIPLLNEYHIISDYCIGCNGEVASVCLFSDVPIEQVNTVLLDYQSRTSVALFKILLKHYWKISPQLENARPGFENSFKGDTAALIIGDRALMQRKSASYIYDLGSAWKEMTGLPFVFAAWISNKEFPDSFNEAFNNAQSMGFDHIPDIVYSNPFPDYDLKYYYTTNIDYRLDENKRAALELFLQYLSADK